MKTRWLEAVNKLGSETKNLCTNHHSCRFWAKVRSIQLAAQRATPQQFFCLQLLAEIVLQREGPMDSGWTAGCLCLMMILDVSQSHMTVLVIDN